jgi:hypothetical protein
MIPNKTSFLFFALWSFLKVLVDFIEFYGNEFNPKQDGISVRDPGSSGHFQLSANHNLRHVGTQVSNEMTGARRCLANKLL